MARQLGLITCASFDRELLACQSSPDLRDVRFVTLPVRCDHAEASWPGLGEAVGSCRRDGCAVAVAGGYCLTRPVKALGLNGTCRLHQKGQCFEWLADKDVLDKTFHGGAALLLPGWLADWETHVEDRWPGEPKAALAYFREVARKVVLLDTGVRPGIERALKEFSRFVKLPGEVFPIGIDFFKLSLARVALGWRLDSEREETENRLAAARQQVSGLARVAPLLGAVTQARSLADAHAGVVELFRVLLPSREAVLHEAEALAAGPAAEGSPLDRIVSLNADCAWSDDRGTVFLKLAHERRLLGVLEIRGFAAEERPEADLDLALSWARIAGLALAGFRTAQALAAERERAQKAEAALAAGEDKMTQIFSYPLGIYRATPQGQILDAAPTLVRMFGYPDLASLQAVNFWDLHHDPRDRESWQAVLESSSMVEYFETQLRRRDGALFWAKDQTRAARDSRGKVLYYDGVIEDITRKKQMEEDHFWEVQLRSSVSEVSERLLSPTPIDVMSDVILENARRLTSSATAFVGHVDERTGGLVAAALTPDARALVAAREGGNERLHENSGMWRWVLEKRKPILTNMTSLDPRYTGMPDGHFPVRQFLAVPAIMSGAIVGLIVVANATAPYVERDLQAVERLADLYAIAVHRTRTENEMRELSLYDELTKIYNRRGFLALAEQQVKVAHRTKKEMALFYADLDDLKRINDTHGHEEGDAALVQAAAILREAFRDSDIIARLGGDEFVVLAIDVAEGRAAALARRLRDMVQARNERPGAAYPVSFSLGVARYEPDKPCSVQELLAQADRKMYLDKTARKRAALTS
jgi:diguanylate cyclase (GGDEF)-like protein/PAS domain S-box-containing protein